MIQLKRASEQECREKALPILVKGYEQRGSWRSESENALRAQSKAARDERNQTTPHFSSI